jgi:predicted porin
VCTLCDTLSALAALAAVSAASAQSSVTLYGVADVWVGQTSTTTAPATQATKQIVMGSGGYNGSRWGLRGTEDLGGGLKANFQIENGFNIDTGAAVSGTSLFNRQAYVGLAGGFGSINFGRQYTAYDDARGAANANNVLDTAFTPVGDVYGYGQVGDYVSRTDNTIKYASPSFGGVSGAISYALGEDKPAPPAPGSAGSTLGAHIKYVNGPLGVFVGIQNQNPAGVNTNDTKFASIGANYDFGIARLSAGFQNAKLGTSKDNEFHVGVAVPFGPATFSLGFASTKGKVGSADGDKGTGFGATVGYDLSKRTAAYVGLKSTKEETSGGANIVKASLFAVGVRHRF